MRGCAGRGWQEISLDLIVGLPHQTRESWRETLERAMASGVPHMSVYMLEVDEESRLGAEMLRGGARYGAAQVPTEDEGADWFQLGCERLAGAGWEQYEISNFARAGHRSRHNLKYWTRAAVCGVRAGCALDAATGRREMRCGLRTRVIWTEYVSEGAAGVADAARGAGDEGGWSGGGVRGDVVSGLRMVEGVELAGLRAEFGAEADAGMEPALAECEDAGLLEREAGWVRLTARGRMVSNEVFSRLLVGQAA